MFLRLSVALFLFSSAANSATVTINFEGVVGSSPVDLPSPVLVDGYQFTNSGSPTIRISSPQPSYGDSMVFCQDCTLRMERTDANVFDLYSFDYMAVGVPLDIQLTVTGWRGPGSGYVQQIFSDVSSFELIHFGLGPQWSGLEWVTFSYNDASGFGSVIDNITVSAVPIPGAVWLFGSALVGLAGIRRKTFAP